MKNLAPICLFTYNRLDQTKQTVEALQKNFLAKKSDLIIFSDGAKNELAIIKIKEVRKYLKSITDFKTVTIYESSNNKGLANSIIDGVSKVIKQYGKVIVLEDDLISTPNFLDFMNQALDFYKESYRIQSINGYSLKIENKLDIYFHQRTFSWGWATWKDRWSSYLFDKDHIQQKIKSTENILSEFDRICGNDISNMLQDSISGINNSWYVRWTFDHFINKTYAVFPTSSKIFNIGFVGEATHCVGINTYISEIDTSYKRTFLFLDFEKMNRKQNIQFLRYFKKSYKLMFRIKLLNNFNGLNQLSKEIKHRLFQKRN